jgi:hypothetical protein
MIRETIAIIWTYIVITREIIATTRIFLSLPVFLPQTFIPIQYILYIFVKPTLTAFFEAFLENFQVHS